MAVIVSTDELVALAPFPATSVIQIKNVSSPTTVPSGTLRIGGDPPTGVVLSGMAPVSRTIDLYDRDSKVYVATTSSSAIDGSFQFSNLSNRQYDVIIRGIGTERDIIIPNVTPVA